MANSLEYVQSITSDRTELDARYERINQTWADSEIPDFVLSTPDWQSGWEVLLGWVSRHVSGTDWPWPPQDRRPLTNARWSNEVHIFSHMINRGVGGHSAGHVAIEEEGTRLILEWWNERPGKWCARPLGRCDRQSLGSLASTFRNVETPTNSM